MKDRHHLLNVVTVHRVDLRCRTTPLTGSGHISVGLCLRRVTNLRPTRDQFQCLLDYIRQACSILLVCQVHTDLEKLIDTLDEGGEGLVELLGTGCIRTSRQEEA